MSTPWYFQRTILLTVKIKFARHALKAIQFLRFVNSNSRKIEISILLNYYSKHSDVVANIRYYFTWKTTITLLYATENSGWQQLHNITFNMWSVYKIEFKLHVRKSWKGSPHPCFLYNNFLGDNCCRMDYYIQYFTDMENRPSTSRSKPFRQNHSM